MVYAVLTTGNALQGQISNWEWTLNLRFLGLLCLQVAVRSEEPYKLQGYSILKSLSAPDYISDPDATGKLFSALPSMADLS